MNNVEPAMLCDFYRRGVLAFLFSLRLSLLTLLFIAFLPVYVDSAPFYWEFINVNIEVQENGDMLVTETQKYVFTAAHTNERYRWIPLDKVDRIDNVEVYEEERKLSATTGIEDNLLWIRWRHALSPPESHTFVLKYRVKGGLHIHDDSDQVYWKALFKDRAAPIQSGRVTVRLPASLAGQVLSYKSFGVAADAREVDDQTVEFIPRGAVPPGRGLEIQMVFPHGLLDVPAPAWLQTQYNFRWWLLGGGRGFFSLSYCHAKR